MDQLVLTSGCRVVRPEAVASAMLTEEWSYYDGVPDPHPDRIESTDVLVTAAVNSFLNSAGRIRAVHRALAAACDHRLEAIPVGARLLDIDPGVLEDLLDAACQVPWVFVPVATKFLHASGPS